MESLDGLFTRSLSAPYSRRSLMPPNVKIDPCNQAFFSFHSLPRKEAFFRWAFQLLNCNISCMRETKEALRNMLDIVCFPAINFSTVAMSPFFTAARWVTCLQRQWLIKEIYLGAADNGKHTSSGHETRLFKDCNISPAFGLSANKAQRNGSIQRLSHSRSCLLCDTHINAVYCQESRRRRLFMHKR